MHINALSVAFFVDLDTSNKWLIRCVFTLTYVRSFAWLESSLSRTSAPDEFGFVSNESRVFGIVC